MVASNQADMTAVIRARDEATPVFRRMGNEVQRSQRIFGGFNKMLGVLGLTSLSLGFGLRAVIQQTDQMRQSVANTNLIVGQLGPEFAKAVDDIRPLLGDLAEEFGFTAADAETAFGIMLRESRNPTIGILELGAAMGLARATGIGLAQAADILGKALLGDIGPLRALFGEVGDLEGAMEDMRKEGLEATSQLDKLGAQFKTTAGKLGEGFGNIMGPFLDAIGKTDAAIVALLRKLGLLPDIDITPAAATPTPIEVAPTPRPEVEALAAGFEKFAEDSKRFWTQDVPTQVGQMWTGFKEEFMNFTDQSKGFWLERVPGWITNLWKGFLSWWFEFTAKSKDFWLVRVPGWIVSLWTGFKDEFTTFVADSKKFWTVTVIGWITKIGTALLGAIRAAIDIIPGWVRDLVTGNFSLSGLLGMKTGGIVPGPIGRPVPAVVHGGEMITPVGGRRGMGGGGSLTVIIEGNVDNEITARRMVREFERLLTENARRGVGI